MNTRLCLRSILLVLLCLALPPEPLDATPLRLMVLGDSVSQGGERYPSFRDPLIRMLAGANINNANPDSAAYDVIMVGSQSATYLNNPTNTSHPTGIGAQPNHEGHWGWRADEILNGPAGAPPGSGTGKLSVWLAAHPADIVLVHLGTNDAIQNGDNLDPDFVNNTWAELVTIVSTIHTALPHARVFLARPVPLSSPFTAAQIQNLESLGNKIASSIGETSARFVEFPGFNADTMTHDDVHPNTTGENLMASAWFTAIKPTLDLFSWRCTHFGSAANAGPGADSADFDGDGSRNLLEWALHAMDPAVPDQPPVETALNDGLLTINAAKNPLAVDVQFSAEAGDSPDNLSSAHAEVLSDDEEVFTARDSGGSPEAERRFIRLRVSRSE